MKREKTNKAPISKKQKTHVVPSGKNTYNYLIFGLLIGIIVFIINYSFFIPDEYTLFQLSLSKKLFTFISLVFGGIIFYSLFKIGDKLTVNLSKYIFLLLLLYSISISLIPVKEYSEDFLILYHTLTAFQTLFIVPTIALGTVSIWAHRFKLQEIVNDLFSKKEIPKEDLSVKDKIFNPVKHLFSKKELFNTIGLFIIIGISVLTLFYRLDYFDLYSDEGTLTQGAIGYYHSGEFKFWDFAKDELLDIEYRRAIPHQYIVAQSYKIFGISTWSSRFPSVVFGILLIITGYFIARYFIKDPLTALLIVFSFSLYFEFLLLQRWARMYALLFPSVLFLFYLSYRFLTEPLAPKFMKYSESSIFNKYFNFNYIILPFLLLILVFSIILHVNSTIILPALFLFVLISAPLFREKKYISLVIIGGILIISQIIYPFLFRYKTLTLFEVNNTDFYSQFFFGYPFTWKTGITILIIGISVLIIAENKILAKRYTLLYLTAFFGWIFFALIVNFSVSFRYMSFLSPLAIFLIIGLYILISKTLFNKYIQILLILLLVVSVFTQFKTRYNDLYVKNFASPSHPSVAWRTIIDNFEEGELLYRHWGTMLYFDDIDSSAEVKSIGSGKKYVLPLNILIDTLKNYKSGWLTWDTHNSHVLDPEVPEYCNIYFDKLHGYGLDTLGVEVFHYVDSLIVDTTQFKADRFLPAANLNLNNDFSLTFLFKINEASKGSPFTFQKGNEDVISIVFKPDDEHKLFIEYLNEPQIVIENSRTISDEWHHMTLYKKTNNNELGLYIDGQLIKSKIIKELISGIIKFKVNPVFNGQINDLRIYDFVLNPNQIQTVIQNVNSVNSEVLISDDIEFRTLYHWQKQ